MADRIKKSTKHKLKTHAAEHLGSKGLPPPLKGDDRDGGLGQLLLFPGRIRHCSVKAIVLKNLWTISFINSL
jgi:hypothetical protein